MERSRDECMHCTHDRSVHFTNDLRGLGSKDMRDVKSGCSYVMPNGMPCQCPGFRPR